MQFNLCGLLIAVLWIAVGMAGYSLSGRLGAGLMMLLFGLATACGKLTLESWANLQANEKRIGVFATGVSVMGLVVLFLALIARSIGPLN